MPVLGFWTRAPCGRFSHLKVDRIPATNALDCSSPERAQATPPLTATASKGFPGTRASGLDMGLGQQVHLAGKEKIRAGLGARIPSVGSQFSRHLRSGRAIGKAGWDSRGKRVWERWPWLGGAPAVSLRPHSGPS